MVRPRTWVHRLVILYLSEFEWFHRIVGVQQARRVPRSGLFFGFEDQWFGDDINHPNEETRYETNDARRNVMTDLPSPFTLASLPMMRGLVWWSIIGAAKFINKTANAIASGYCP